MENAEGQTADWVQNLMRDFQDKLVCGLYEAIYSLDESSQDTLMKGQARTCVAAYLDLTKLPSPMDLDSFLETMRTTGPSQVDIHREGDVINWTERHQGQCVCPFVRREVVRLAPPLCNCGSYWMQYLFQAVTKTDVEVEMLETVATGSQDCCFRITVKSEAQPEKSA
jgi:hypothetical protein